MAPIIRFHEKSDTGETLSGCSVDLSLQLLRSVATRTSKVGYCSKDATAERFADRDSTTIRSSRRGRVVHASLRIFTDCPQFGRHLVKASRFAKRSFLMSTAIVMAIPDLAFAQAAAEDPNVTVVQRSRPELDPLGIRAGTFLAFPELSINETYSDNVGFEEDDEQSDFTTLISPSVNFESQWSRHQLGIELGSDIAINAEESDEDFQDVSLDVDGTLEVSRQTQVTGNAIGRFTHEGRDDPEEAGGDELTNFFDFGGGAAINHQLNRLGFGLSANVLRTVFEDNDEDDRDATIYDFVLRTSYEVSPRLDMFVEGAYNLEDRDDAVDDDGIARDTDAYEVRLGAGLDITSVLFGEVFAGYIVQRFDEDGFDNEEGVSFGINLNWNPTQLTSVGFRGERDFEPTDEGGAASNFQTEVGVSVDHELLRNLIIGGDVVYQRDDFRGDDREDDTFILGGELTYWFNRNVSVNGGYTYSDRESSDAGQDFQVNEISVGLTFRL